MQNQELRKRITSHSKYEHAKSSQKHGYTIRLWELDSHGVENRVHFQKGDAAALDFAADTLDGVISNLTFHEVKSVADKREVLREALRGLKVI